MRLKDILAESLEQPVAPMTGGKRDGGPAEVKFWDRVCMDSCRALLGLDVLFNYEAREGRRPDISRDAEAT